MKNECFDDIALARALSTGASTEQRAHLASCEACRARWGSFDRAIALARELQPVLPSAARREELRTEVLAAMVRPRPVVRKSRGTAIAVAAAVLAVAAGAVLVIRRRGEPAPGGISHRARGTVHPAPLAIVELASNPPDEIVRLHDGAIDVDVDPLAAGERFRVVVGDAEIEVRGTSFSAVASRDHLVAVRVAHGRVDVRPQGRVSVTLERGQAWTVNPRSVVAPPLAPVAPPVPSRAAAKPPLRIHSVAAPPAAEAPGLVEPTERAEPVARSADELAYDEGWAAMRRSEFAEAAAAFARVTSASSLGDDAAYWHGVAAGRAGHKAEAVHSLRALLAASVRSIHYGEASAILGWLLVDMHELDEARERFEAAVADPDPTVVTSGRAGLRALAAARP